MHWQHFLKENPTDWVSSGAPGGRPVLGQPGWVGGGRKEGGVSESFEKFWSRFGSSSERQKNQIFLLKDVTAAAATIAVAT